MAAVLTLVHLGGGGRNERIFPQQLASIMMGKSRNCSLLLLLRFPPNFLCIFLVYMQNPSRVGGLHVNSNGACCYMIKGKNIKAEIIIIVVKPQCCASHPQDS